MVGCGCGPESLTAGAMDAIRDADLLVGAPRLLALFPEKEKRISAVTAQDIEATVRTSEAERVCVLFSGDSGFYSGARQLLPVIKGEEWEILPGISSLQILAARLGEPWQDWRLCSAHGVEIDPVSEVCHGRKVFFLTGGKLGPAEICRSLTEAGLRTLEIVVGENLGTQEEKIIRGTAEKFAGRAFAPLSVVLVEAAPRYPARVPGIPDDQFERGEMIPMTKQEVRVAALALLGAGPEDTCWDIGTGTGSVAVELALQTKLVCGIEQKQEALQVAGRNRKKFGVWNLRLVEGSAPEALESLPTPDAVFVGGSGGRMGEILTAVQRANPEARICVSVITLESVQAALDSLRKLGYETDVRQVAVSRGRKAGGLTMMQGQNPVFLILGTRT